MYIKEFFKYMVIEIIGMKKKLFFCFEFFEVKVKKGVNWVVIEIGFLCIFID